MIGTFIDKQTNIESTGLFKVLQDNQPYGFIKRVNKNTDQTTFEVIYFESFSKKEQVIEVIDEEKFKEHWKVYEDKKLQEITDFIK